MKISVQTNKNIIFFEALISFINKGEDFHPLGQKIIEEFKDIKKTEIFKDFEESLKEKRIPSHPWQYMFLAVNLNDDLTTKSLSPTDGFGPNREKAYLDSIYQIVNKIHSKSNFEERYNEKILPDYEIVTKDIQKLFDKENPGDTLKDFWGDELKVELIFIPDPLRVGGGSGVSRGKEFYSITGTVKSDDEVVFKPSHMISNLLHEYSHSFFKVYLYENEGLLKKNVELCNILSKKIEKNISNEISRNYGNSTIYFEETFVRATQILLSRRFFEKTLKKDMKEKTLEQLKKREDEGFIYIEKFYNELENNKKPINSYIKVLEDIVKKS